MSKKVLITGASGFVGSFLVEKALSLGYETYAGIRSSSSLEYLKDERIRLCYMDFNKPEELETILATLDLDYIIHNAGLTKAREESAYFKVNTELLSTFLKSIKNSGITLSKFVFISSLAAYGPAEFTSDGIVKEDSTPKPVTAYGKSKLAAERLIKETTTLPYNIIRPTAVYGPREQDFLTVYKMINQGLELFIGSETQKLTFIYVQDLVDQIFNVMQSAKSQKNYFVSDGKYYSAEQLHDYVKAALGRKTIKIKLPLFLVKGLAHISEFASKFTGKYPPLNPQKVAELKCKSWVCDTGPLQAEFSFQPKYYLADGIENTIKWNKQRKLI